MTSDEPVWRVPVPNNFDGVGGGRVLVISKATGEVLADEVIGE
jgi:ABC-type phosphate transport system permease subunit